MIALVPLLLSIAVLAVAQFLTRIVDARRARSIAAVAVLVLAVASVIGIISVGSVSDEVEFESGLRLEFVAGGWRSALSTVNLLVALLAVGLAPSSTHPTRTLVAILRCVAAAMAFTAFTHPVPLALLWAVAAIIVHQELREWGDVGRGLARVMRRYHVPSVVFAAVGTVALLAGSHEVGAVFWLLAIAVREAAILAHGWLPILFTRAPLGLAVAFVAPQSGIFAHIVLLSDLPGGGIAHGFAFVGVVTAVLGAVIGLVQTSALRAAAWLVISQTGLVAFGLENASEVGLSGAVMCWQVTALATSGFVMTIAALGARRGTLVLAKASGSFARTPRMAVGFLVLGFASVGLPLTLGFVAEDLLIQGSVDEFPVLGAALVVATALNGINVLRCFFALFSGTSKHIGERDLTRLEACAMSVVMAVLVLGGAFPRYFVPFAIRSTPVEHSK